MNRYRLALSGSLAANIVLAGFVAVLLWQGRAAVPPAQATGSGSIASVSEPGVASQAAAPGGTEQPLAPVQLSPQRLQSIGVSFDEVRSKVVQDRIPTTGNVAVDETRLSYVQTRFSGYIQKVFVDATYQRVRKGDPLFTIYSPELVSTEREYLAARQNQQALAGSSDPQVARDAAALVAAAAARLEQWSIPRREIARLERTGEVRQDLTIDSPASGFVTEREALPNKFAQPDTRLYTVADLSTIWVLAQVYQSDLGRLRVDDRATLTVDTYPGRTFEGRVDFMYPDIDMTTRTARVRLKFPNPDLKLLPGMFVNVSLEVPMGRREVIPASGVLDTGTRQIVFVDHGGGSLEPREVQLGVRVGDEYIVLGGLKSGERIVTSANFLIDSESQLQAALGAFMPPTPGPGPAQAPPGPQLSMELETEPSPPRKGDNVARVKLAAKGGAPITGAQVSATFFMAAMPAMGMAAMRVSATFSERGNGLYQGAVRLGSGGTWTVTVVAVKDGRTIASRQLSVDATGGM